MAIPDYQTLMRPILTRTASGGEHRARDLVSSMTEAFNLTAEERVARLPSGQPVMANRVHWAIATLLRHGLIERPSRAIYLISDVGRRALEQGPERFDLAFLASFAPVNADDAAGGAAGDATATSSTASSASQATPDERIAAALNEIERALREDLLQRIRSSSPEFFERLVLDLLTAMGYGEPESSQHLGGPGDGGVDGVINLDKLGLEKVYIQAKRYDATNTIGPSTIQAFAGALDTKGTTKGVFVTTSFFTAAAKSVVERINNKRLVLIDGDELAGLLIKHNIAVRKDRDVVVKRLDEDYFED